MRKLMFRLVCCAVCTPVLIATPSFAQSPHPACEELVLLFIELGKRSGQDVTLEQARAEVLSENPSNEECQAMLALFPKLD